MHGEGCVARDPSKFNITWLPKFSFAEELKALGLSNTAVTLTNFYYGLMDVQPPQDGVLAGAVRSVLGDLSRIIDSAGDGWLLGQGRWLDPCIDRQGVLWTIIMYGIFGGLLLVVLLDALRQLCSRGETSGSRI